MRQRLSSRGRPALVIVAVSILWVVVACGGEERRVEEPASEASAATAEREVPNPHAAELSAPGSAGETRRNDLEGWSAAATAICQDELEGWISRLDLTDPTIVVSTSRYQNGLEKPAEEQAIVDRVIDGIIREAFAAGERRYERLAALTPPVTAEADAKEWLAYWQRDVKERRLLLETNDGVRLVNLHRLVEDPAVGLKRFQVLSKQLGVEGCDASERIAELGLAADPSEQRNNEIEAAQHDEELLRLLATPVDVVTWSCRELNTAGQEVGTIIQATAEEPHWPIREIGQGTEADAHKLATDLAADFVSRACQREPGTGRYAVTAARDDVHAASLAIEAYAIDHDTYAGATVSALKTYAPDLPDTVSVGILSASSYCISSTVADKTFFKDGPYADIEEGSC